MANTIRIEQSLTNSISLSSGMFLVKAYGIKASVKDDEVEELITLIVKPLSDFTEVFAQLQKLQQLLADGERSQSRNYVSKVFLILQRHGDVRGEYASEIVGGEIEYDETVLLNIRAGITFEVAVTIQRKNKWRQHPKNLQELLLYSPLSGFSSNGVIVRNFLDQSKVTIPGSNTQTLPISTTPLVIKIKNITNTNSNRVYDVWMYHHKGTAVEEWDGALYGYQSTGPGANVGYADSHGNTYRLREWTGELDVLAAEWTLNADLLAQASGNNHRLLFRSPVTFGLAGLSVYFQLKLEVTILAQTPRQYLDSGQTIQEVGTLALPPQRITGSHFPLTLQMYVRQDIPSNPHYLAIDFLNLSKMDSWRKLISTGYGTPADHTIVDDTIDGELYSLSNYRIGNYVSQGLPLRNEPTKDTTIQIIHNFQSGFSDLSQQLKVRIFTIEERTLL